MNAVRASPFYPLAAFAMACAVDPPDSDTGKVPSVETGGDSSGIGDSADTGDDERPMATVWLSNGSGEELGGLFRSVGGVVESTAGYWPADFERLELTVWAGSGPFFVTDTLHERCWGRDLDLAEGEEVEITTGLLEFEAVGFSCRY